MEVHEAMKPTAPHVTTPTKIDHEAMRPYFAWMPLDRICKTFEHTTQFMQSPSSTYLRKRHRSANPAANTDTIFSDTPAVDGGQTAAQIFAGSHSKFTSIHPLRDTSKEEILGAFQD